MRRARSFGETEFWLAIVKVVTLLGVLACGVVILVLGIGAVGRHASIVNLWSHGGIFPLGVAGLLAALPVVLFAFGGVEVLALAAAETEKPQDALPRAIRGLFYRILLIYVGSLAIVMMLFPWNSFDGATSPFILVLQRVGLPGAESVLTVVAITAVLSSGNSVLFASSRMLRNLASAGQAPAWLQTSNRQGVPYVAVSVGAAAMLVGVGFNYLMPERVFGAVMNTVGWMVLLVWANIMVTHLFYRRALSRGAASRVGFRLPGAPYTNWLVLVTIGFAMLEMVIHGGGRTPPLLLLCWLAVLIVTEWVVGRAGRPRKD
jgi:AAT family amino acid transporter/D-serine/D-alanine/glycine transporter